MNAMDLKLDLTRHYAQAFVRAKRRLPTSQEELVSWLLEFDAALLKVIQHQYDAAVEHANTCIRPMVISRPS